MFLGLSPVQTIGAIGAVASTMYALWRLFGVINEAAFNRMDRMVAGHVAPAVESAAAASAAAANTSNEVHALRGNFHNLTLDVATLKGWTQGYTARNGGPTPFGSDTPAYLDT